ncbi:MAG: adenylate/guanylate cyclase domain-containing protein [Rhodospirillales bacterium]|nr:adenylate/guanylate cyclase domain-containing protein [Rhodospirillales bacterium]
MSEQHPNSSPPLEQPFPLRSHFRRRILPGLLVFLAVLGGAAGIASTNVIQAIYLEQAQRRAETIARAVATAAPDAWAALISGKVAEPGDVIRHHLRLRQTFALEVEELKLARLNVYDKAGKTIFATNTENIGKIETGPAIRGVIDKHQPGIVAKNYPDGSRLHELYVPLLDDAGTLLAVFELYEPVTFLDSVLTDGVISAVTVPGLLLIALVFGLGHLVGRAQEDIDARTDALNRLRQRLETFVSAGAAAAARGAHEQGDIPSERITCTILFSDIRDFTSYAEDHSPEQVVAMINDLMTVQVNTLRAHGGDIDKMIGDAVLALFNGPGAARQAIDAAKMILNQVAAGDHPRGVGIGIFTGDVVSGAIGPDDRRDFTVIGDSVNIASRLCSAAGEGELVVDEATAMDAGDEAFGELEEASVKGRRKSLSVRRWRCG